MKKYLLLILCYSLAVTVAAQNPPPPLNCLDAVPVCQNTYSFPNAFMGIGTGNNEINPSNSCLPNGEQNGAWFIFTIQTAGDLSFVITPNHAGDDYNWSLYNLTNATCQDIFTNSALEVSCNSSTDILGAFNTAAGRTGAYSDPPYYGDLGFIFPAFNGDIAVNTGETYVLYISNASNTNGGFNVDFSPSTAVLFNSLTPDFLFVTPVTCGDDEIKLTLNKPVTCNSVQASDFFITGHTVTGITSYNCDTTNGVIEDEFTLFITPPITSTGNFTLYIQDTISDQCGNFTTNDSITLTVADLVAQAGSDGIFCENDSIAFQLGDTAATYTNTTFSWSASTTWALAAISDVNVAAPVFNYNNAPADTITLYLTATSGSCSSTDSVVLFIRDCCINYNAQITNFQDIGCHGASTGTAEATAIGSISGQNPLSFNYKWSTTQSTFLATGLSANTVYTVTVTDPLGCADTASIILSEPATPISTSATGSTLACFGDSSGTIDLTVQGGTPPYSFSWNNGAGNTEDPSGLAAGTYTVTVVDANNCTITETATVSQPPSALTIAGNASTIACGATNGSITLSVNGGGTPYLYQWDVGPTTKDLLNVGGGTYTVTVTDAFGCTKVESFTINVIGGLTAIASGSQIPCSTSNTGTASVNVSGGLPPYAYAWSTTASSSSISNLSEGLYFVTVTDATSCSVVASATVEVVSTLSATATVNDVSCKNGTNGSIQVTPTSSAGTSFSYLWSTNQTNAQISNLTAGTYSVTITDANNCQLIETYTVSEPQDITIVLNPTPVSCFNGNDGLINATMTGGTPPYSFSWSNNATTQHLIGLTANTYTLTVTDANNCIKTQSVTISQPSALTATLLPSTITCSGTATGNITTTPNGGTPPYTYQWSSGAAPVQNPSGLATGTYFLTLTDNNGCIFTSSTTINELPPMTATATPTPASCNGSGDGSISVSITNGVSPFTFQWSSGVMGNIQNPTGLSAGMYTVTITDANNCTTTATATVTQPTAISATATGSTILCGGTPTGSITLTVNGGTPPYNFNWNNGGGTSQNPTNVFAGTYTVTITDANNCINVVSAVVSELPAMQLQVSSDSLDCFGDSDGSLSVAATNGQPPYSYLWNTTATTPTVNNLTAGTYSVTVTDANNCVHSINGFVHQPNDINVQAAITNVSCTGNTDGAITLNVMGGTSPYTYNWDNGLGSIQNPANLAAGVYNVTVTDGHNCTKVATIPITAPNPMILNTIENPPTCNQNNGLIAAFPSGGTSPFTYTWSPNAGVSGNTNTATNLGSGTYSVTVTDNNGCTAKKENIVFSPATPFNATAAITNPNCLPNNGQIFVSVNSNNVPFTYTWSANANTGNTNLASGLSATAYSLTITDGSSCDTVMNFTLQPPTLLSAGGLIQPPTCGQANGQISINIALGTPPYQYTWSPNTNTGDTSVAANLVSGSYFVTIVDGSNCSEVLPFTVIGGDSLGINEVVTPPTCTQNGNITLNMASGTAPYVYTWSANANTGNTAMATDLVEGIYQVTITDAANCSTTRSFTLVKEGDFTINLDDIQDNDCHNGQNGSIAISTTSLSNNLTYQWSNQATTEDLNNLAAGSYSVTVTDVNTGCTASDTYIIDEPEEITIDLGNDITISTGQEITLDPNLSNPDLLYNWLSNGSFITNQPTLTISPLQTTTIILSVTIGNCPPVTDDITITVENEGDLVRPEAFSPNGDGQNDIFRVFPQPGDKIQSMKIFNRWGEVVHDGNNWDGTFRGLPMPNGAYPYIISLLKIDGTEERIIGEVILVR